MKKGTLISFLLLFILVSCSEGESNKFFNGKEIVKRSDSKAEDWQRTVIFIYGRTRNGQDMFIRGGIDWDYARENLGRDCSEDKWLCAIPIRHRHFLDDPNRANDRHIDWYGEEIGQSVGTEGSPLVWTTNDEDNSHNVDDDGYGFTALNEWGDHYWMLDVDMDCSKTNEGWFELKSYISNGPGWEGNITQSGAPYSSANHFGECGKMNVFISGQDDSVTIKDIPIVENKIFPSLYLRGTYNGWNANDDALMEFISDFTWQKTVTFDEPGNFKFDVYGNWNKVFGDNENDNIADRNGNDITIHAAGQYTITMNDKTKEYSVVLNGNSNWLNNDPGAIWKMAPGFYKKDQDWYAIIHVKDGAQTVELVGDFTNGVQLTKTPDGKFWWFKGTDADFDRAPETGDDYRYRVTWANGSTSSFQDPAARWLERNNGLGGSSKVLISSDYQWNDQAWKREWKNYSIYEMHARRFTSRNNGNSFQQITEELNGNGDNDYLNELGVKAIQFMPLHEFMGDYSWGYNPAFFYAVESSYGSPADFKRLIDTAHQNGIAVFIDLVYSHAEWGDLILGSIDKDAYFDGRTIWGPLINFDNDITRHFFAQNAKYFVEEYHIDGFRLDATRAIHTYDDFIKWAINEPGNGGGYDFLREIRTEVKKADPAAMIIAEELPNDWYGTRERINEPYKGDWHGPFDGQWADWFEENLRRALTGGSIDGLSKIFSESFGGINDNWSDSWHDPILYVESHDEVGNHDGRIAKVGRDGKGMEMSQISMAATVLARGIPMIFMGQESAETRQFLINGNGVWNRRLPLDTYETDSQQKKVLAWSSKMFEIRNSDSVLSDGGISVTHLYNQNGVVAFTRHMGKYLVILNFKGTSWNNYGVGVSGNYQEIANSSWAEYNVGGTTENTRGRDVKYMDSFHIPAYGAVVLKRID